MKFKFVFTILAIISVLFVACDDSATNLGKEIQPINDQIYLKTDTFHLSSETYAVDNIISRPDSFLLGTFVDKVYGTTRADILGQVYFPKNYKYYDSSIAVTEPDSVNLLLVFNSSFGSEKSPMEISVYELKETLQYMENYPSNLDPSLYVDYNKILGKGVMTVVNAVDSTRNTSVSIKLSADFVKRFFSTDPSIFSSEANFYNFFKGLYITSINFGSATMLNISGIYLNLYYHYTYKSDGKVVKGSLTFPASLEAKQVNRIFHPERTLVLSPDDEVNYISSPANYYTRVNIPLKRIRERVNVDGKHLMVNSAILRLDAVDKKGTSTELPYINNMLLVKESALNNFFKDRKLTSDTCAFLAKVDSSYVSSAEVYKKFYTFNQLATLINTELSKPLAEQKDNLTMVLVPVSPGYTTTSSSSSTIPTPTSINQNSQLEAVGIYSGKNKKIPMKLEVVFSGF